VDTASTPSRRRRAVSFLHDLIYSPLYALLWNSHRDFLDIDINARTAQTVPQFLLQDGNARRGMKLTNGRVFECVLYSSFLHLHLFCANQTAQSPNTPSICRQNHHIATSLHQRTTPTSALPAHAQPAAYDPMRELSLTWHRRLRISAAFFLDVFSYPLPNSHSFISCSNVYGLSSYPRVDVC
jgi:hypothetical protein